VEGELNDRRRAIVRLSAHPHRCAAPGAPWRLASLAEIGGSG
jgi:hypothetical protein